MAGQGEKVTISVSGGSPWGFRLFGGEDQPLSVAKVSQAERMHVEREKVCRNQSCVQKQRSGVFWSKRLSELVHLFCICHKLVPERHFPAGPHCSSSGHIDQCVSNRMHGDMGNVEELHKIRVLQGSCCNSSTFVRSGMQQHPLRWNTQEVFLANTNLKPASLNEQWITGKEIRFISVLSILQSIRCLWISSLQEARD